MSLETLSRKSMFNDQIRCEFLKFEIRGYSICYWISKARKRKSKKINFLNKLKEKANIIKNINTENRSLEIFMIVMLKVLR